MMRYKRKLGLGLSLLLSVTSPFSNQVYAEEDIGTKEEITLEIKEKQLEVGLTLEEEGISIQTEPAAEDLLELLKEHTILGTVYLCDSYDIREEADGNSAIVSTVLTGQTVQILYEKTDVNDVRWLFVSFYANDKECHGYIERNYVACSDEQFLEWETSYDTFNSDVWGSNGSFYSVEPYTNESERELNDFANAGSTYGVTSYSGNSVTPYVDVASDKKASPYETEVIVNDYFPDIEAFPESYQASLIALKQQHPNWTFVRQEIGLNWNTVLDNELTSGRSLIPTSYPAYMSSGAYGTSWKNANRETLSYYLDPRNGLTEERIFQFEQLTYNASYHVESSIQMFLNSTFMSGTIPGDASKTYANTFWEVGKSLGVSPFHLASRVYQEQGKGNSSLISGTYPGYEGYYNYFNIGATGTTDEEVIKTGLEYAKEQDWSSVYKALYGGGYFIAKNYILKGQDTIYLQKFDVDGSANGLYWHQYMQNIVAPTSEASTVRKQYVNSGSIDNTFVFKIPVYQNMPSKACEKPNGYKVTISCPSGFSKEEIVVDGISYEPNVLGSDMTIYLSNANAKIATFYQYNSSGAPVNMVVYSLQYNSGGNYTVAQLSDFNNLLSYHGFSMRITGETGLRAKMGIDRNVRDKLTSAEGLNGYHLKKYGNLIMYKYNYEKYPMICGGTKVGEAVSYDQSKGIDKIFETVDNRYRFTVVFTGIPVSSYQLDFVFRSFIVLTKDGQDVTIYGPPVNRSLYTLSSQLLATGKYAPGTDTYQFLQKVIEDADAYEAGNN